MARISPKPVRTKTSAASTAGAVHGSAPTIASQGRIVGGRAPVQVSVVSGRPIQAITGADRSPTGSFSGQIVGTTSPGTLLVERTTSGALAIPKNPKQVRNIILAAEEALRQSEAQRVPTDRSLPSSLVAGIGGVNIAPSPSEGGFLSRSLRRLITPGMGGLGVAGLFTTVAIEAGRSGFGFGTNAAQAVANKFEDLNAEKRIQQLRAQAAQRNAQEASRQASDDQARIQSVARDDTSLFNRLTSGLGRLFRPVGGVPGVPGLLVNAAKEAAQFAYEQGAGTIQAPTAWAQPPGVQYAILPQQTVQSQREPGFFENIQNTVGSFTTPLLILGGLVVANNLTKKR